MKFQFPFALLLVCGFAAAQPSASSNPLLGSAIPIPFDQIKADHVVPAADHWIAEARRNRESYVAAKEKPTFENTVVALENIGSNLFQAMGIVGHLNSVASTPALRDAMTAVLPKVTAIQSELTLDPKVWSRLKSYAATAEAKSLTGSRQRLLDLTLKRFRRAGADLNEAGRKRIAEIDVEMASLSKKFNDNVLDATNAWDLVIADEAKLAGLPETARAAAREAAKQKGVPGWRITLHAPSMLPVLQYLDDPNIRETVYRASHAAASAGAQDNTSQIRRILQLRRERAKLLGYRDHADYQTEERMARTGAKAREFVETLDKKTRPAFDKEKAELVAFRRKLEGPAAPEPAAWEGPYYTQKLRKARYDFDLEALRPYFAFPNVMAGVFDLTNKLYGVKVNKVQGAPVWHPTVEYYEMRDADGSLLGYFYTDFFTRPGKRNGAWANTLIHRNGSTPLVGTITGNVTPPGSDTPSLLTHREVATIFHEFGHLTAFLLNRVEERGIQHYVWDFVEAPSQIMENWTWERACLDMFARHYKTGEKMPDDLFNRAIAARNFQAATAQMGQLGYSSFDLALHTTYDPYDGGDPVVHARNVMQRFSPYNLSQDTMATRFLHLFAGGYAAGYYSYKWAEALEADFFTRFQKEGIFNPKVGQEFRKKVLERGNSADASVLFRDFMHRDPDPDALLRRSGLLSSR